MTDTVHVKLKIKSAHKLIKRSLLKYPDPFVQIFVNDQKLSTHCIEKTINPVWNESFELNLHSYKDKIEIIVWNNRLFTKRKSNAFLGHGILSTYNLGEIIVDLSKSSTYPHKSVRGYLVVELTRISSTNVVPSSSNPQMAPPLIDGNNQDNGRSILSNNCYTSHSRTLSTDRLTKSKGEIGRPHTELMLPQGFERRVSETGKIYFFDLSTGCSHWYHPAVPKYFRKITDFSCLGPLPFGWDSLQSDSGLVYYIDHVARTTQYTDPRLITALALPNGVQFVIDKLREAGTIVKDQQSSSLVGYKRAQEKSMASTSEHSAIIPQFSSRSYTNVEGTSHDNPPLVITDDTPNTHNRSPSSKIQSHALAVSTDSQLNISITHENGHPVCDHEIVSLPLQRHRISHPTSSYILNNRHYIEVKLKILRQNLKDLMLRKLCIIETSRDNILEESYVALKKLKPADMRRRLVLKFTDEEGLDYGGVAREWLYLLSETLFSCRHGLFETNCENDGNLLRVSAHSSINENHLSYFHFIGRVIGMAIFHGYYVDADFCKIFYKNILNKKPTLEDFKELDPSIYNSLKWILENDIDAAYLDLTFSIDQVVFGELTVIDLCDNGRCIPVTDNVKRLYIDRYVEYQLMEQCADQYYHIKKGIYEVLPNNCLSVLNEDELEVLLTGISEIKIEDWKKNTRFKHCTPNEPLVQWFWDAVESFTEQQRIKLLQFVTGSSRIPLSGFEGLRGSYGSDEPKLFTIKVIRDSNPQSLPKAHTCFNRLDMPPYSSYKCLLDKLTCAIEETCGFAVM